MTNKQSAELIYFSEGNSTELVERLLQEHKLCHIMSGALEIFYGGKLYQFGEGDTILFRRNQLVKARLQNGSQEPFTAFKIAFPQAFIKQYYADSKMPPSKQLTAPFVDEQLISIKGNELLTSFFQSLKPYYNKANRITEQLFSHKTQEIMLILEQTWPGISDLFLDFNMPEKIDLIAFMQKNYSFNIPLNEFAYLSGRSLTTFKRDFFKSFGTSPHRWLLQKRLDEALVLIEKQQQAVSDVYLQVGFESLAHFSTVFKKNFGYPPSAVNKQG